METDDPHRKLTITDHVNAPWKKKLPKKDIAMTEYGGSFVISDDELSTHSGHGTLEENPSVMDEIKNHMEQVTKAEENSESLTRSFDYVQAKEFQVLLKRREKAKELGYKTVAFNEHDPRPVGVAFSGGGIRACAYSMGALLAMKEKDFLPQVDYTSSVSGGGFTAIAYTSYLFAGQKGSLDSVQDLHERMKKKCGYVVDRSKPWQMPFDVLAILLSVASTVLLGKVPALVVALYPISIWIHFVLGDSLHQSFSDGVLTQNLKIGMIAVSGVCLFTLVLVRRVRNTTRDWRVYMFFQTLRAVAVHIGWWNACLVNVWFLHVFTSLDTEFVWSLAIFLLSFLMFYGLIKVFPYNTMFALFPLLVGYAISATWYFRIYWWEQLEWIHGDDYGVRFNVVWLILLIGLQLLNTLGNVGIIQGYWQFRLRYAFTAPEMNTLLDTYKMDSSISTKVCEEKAGPYLLCNATLNNYRRNPRDLKYNHFTFAPLFSGCDLVGYADSSKLNSTLSSSMAISSAVFNSRMGKYSGDSLSANAYMLNMLGLGMGDSISFPTETRWLARASLVPVIVHVVYILTIVLGVFLSPVIPAASWLIAAGFILYLVIFVGNLWHVRLKNGKYLLTWKLMSEAARIMGVEYVGPVPPPLLALTDGGHFENLGVYPLLKRECKLILSIDAGYDPRDSCDELIGILELFHEMGYKFSAEPPIDDEDIGSSLFNSAKISKRKKKMIPAIQAIQMFRHCPERSVLFIVITYPSKRHGALIYVKLRKRLRDAKKTKNVMGCFGDFPYISTANQFYDETLFNEFVHSGYEDTKDGIDLSQNVAPYMK